MRPKYFSSSDGISPAWISYADIFGQLMIMALILAVFFNYRWITDRSDTPITYTVSGKVIGLVADEYSRTSLQEGNNPTISISNDGSFTISDLSSGQHTYILRTINQDLTSAREEVSVEFSMSYGNFNGLQIQAGKLIETNEETSQGPIITVLQETAATFVTGQHQLLVEGQNLINQALENAPQGSQISPLERLGKEPGLRIAIIGQADKIPLYNDEFNPSDYSNFGLSALRAAEAADYIVRYLVNCQGCGFTEQDAKSRVIVMGLGDSCAWFPPHYGSPIEMEYQESTSVCENRWAPFPDGMTEETDAQYNARCRRIIIAYMEDLDLPLLEQIASTP